MRLHPILLALGLLGCLSVSGCFLTDRPMVGVKHVRPEVVDAELNSNALDGKRPSVWTLEFLHTYGLADSTDSVEFRVGAGEDAVDLLGRGSYRDQRYTLETQSIVAAGPRGG